MILWRGRRVKVLGHVNPLHITFHKATCHILLLWGDRCLQIELIAEEENGLHMLVASELPSRRIRGCHHVCALMFFVQAGPNLRAVFVESFVPLRMQYKYAPRQGFRPNLHQTWLFQESLKIASPTIPRSAGPAKGIDSKPAKSRVSLM